jgi:hypothetical protein
MPGSGSGSQNSTTKTKSKTEPWEPTQQPLKTAIAQATSQLDNTALTANESGALDSITARAQQGNPYAGQIGALTDDLFKGGIDRTGLAQGAYNDYKAQSQPYLDPNYLDPYKNPAFQQYQTQLEDRAANRVNGMFAGAGRDFSGANMSELGRGITEATAPLYFDQYNRNVATQTGLMGNLYNAGNSTTGLLSGLDQTALGNRGAGVSAADASLAAQNYGDKATLEAEAMRRGIPMQNLQNVSGLLVPIAGLGQQSSGTNTMQGTYTQPLSQTAQQWTGALNNLYPKAPVR